ncbi:hypothetical protein [Burkholderia sp. 22313]|uniref:hypothetical protein n=1 Tax=Burkholderia sp. 22313 TaxID=3453908 RepID=UPI002B8A787A|nr:hypothetical protein [Burkholderia sp.]
MTTSTTRANPIAVATLLENFWVFALYGVITGWFAGGMAKLHLTLVDMASVMTEPLSYRSFMLLTLTGFIGLGVANASYAKTAERMHASRIVRRILVPIANAGLCTGAIVTGATAGLCVGLLPWSFGDAETMRAVRMLGAMSLFTLALLVPLTNVKRSMFDLTRNEERRSNVVGIVYCVALIGAMWWLDRQTFWYTTLLMGVVFLGVWWLIRHVNRKRGVAAG